MALPLVLAAVTGVLAIGVGVFEVASQSSRRSRDLADRLIAFRAADAALQACVARLSDASASALRARASRNVRDAWRVPGAFDGSEALVPFAVWPGAARAPSCVLERLWQGEARRAHIYLVTARGIGARASSAQYLQAQVRTGAARAEVRWLSVAGGAETSRN
jgi:Tfp pilus assembly protein PilX